MGSRAKTAGVSTTKPGLSEQIVLWHETDSSVAWPQRPENGCTLPTPLASVLGEAVNRLDAIFGNPRYPGVTAQQTLLEPIAVNP